MVRRREVIRQGETLCGAALQGLREREFAGQIGKRHGSRNVLGIGRSLLDNALIEYSSEQLQSLGFHMEPVDERREWSVKFVTRNMLGARAVDAAGSLESYRASDAYDAGISGHGRQIKVGRFILRNRLVMRRVLPDSHLKRCEVEPLLQHCLSDMPPREVYGQQFFLPVGHLDLDAAPGDINVLLNALDVYQNSPRFTLEEAAFGPLQVQYSA